MGKSAYLWLFIYRVVNVRDTFLSIMVNVFFFIYNAMEELLLEQYNERFLIRINAEFL